MASKLWPVVVTSIVTFFLSLGLRFAGDRIIADKGKIIISRPINISNSLYAELEVHNWSSNILDGVIVVIPRVISSDAIGSSAPLSVDEAKGDNSGSERLKRVSLSGFPPHQVTRVFVRLSASNDVQDISLPNAQQLKLSVSEKDTTESPWDPTVRELLLVPLLIALLNGVSLYFWEQRADARFEARRKEREDLFNDLKSKYEINDKRLYDVRSELARHRIYLLARISDYSRELEFWRNVARKLILSGGLGKQHAESFLESVSTSLKTWSTQPKAEREFSSIMEAARLLTSAHIHEE